MSCHRVSPAGSGRISRCVRKRGHKHRSGKCNGDQARAKQDKTGHGHCEETVRSEFITHGTSPFARILVATLLEQDAMFRRTVKRISCQGIISARVDDFVQHPCAMSRHRPAVPGPSFYGENKKSRL